MEWSDKIVCGCTSVTVGEVNEKIEENPHIKNMSLEDKLEELDIAQRCSCCKDLDCDIIDVHYSKVI